MRVFIIGGTGLLGSAAAAELAARGHVITAVALPPLPEGRSFVREHRPTAQESIRMSLEAIAGRTLVGMRAE